MSSLTEVARRAGVSVSTASRALTGNARVSDSARARVQAAADELHYVASATAAGLATGHSRMVGVLAWELNRWFHAEALEGVQTAADEAGYDIALYRDTATAPSHDTLARFLARRRVDATIAIGLPLQRDEVSALKRFQRPVVGIGGRIEGLTTLGVDDVAIARLATEHLLSLGHQDIVHLGGTKVTAGTWTDSRRYEGFRAAMSAAGRAARAHEAAYAIDGGFRAAMSLLAHPHQRPTAIFAGSDEIAIGAVTAARQLGILIPSQLSVIGIDDHYLSELFGVTTFRQEPREYGNRAVRLVVQGMKDGISGFGEVFHPSEVSLVVRASTSAPPP